MCAYDNNNFEMEKEDRLLLEQDTPVFREATVDNETELELRDSEGRDDAVLDGDVRDDAVLEVSGIFKSPDASPVTKQESSVSPVMDSVVLSRSSSAPSSVSPVTDSLLRRVMSPTTLSPTSLDMSSVSPVTDSLDRVMSPTTFSPSSSAPSSVPMEEESLLESSSPSSSPSSSDESTLLIPVFPERDTPAPSRPAAVVDGTQCPVEDIEVGDRLGRCCVTCLTSSGHEQRPADHLVSDGGVPRVLQHRQPGGLGDAVAQRVLARASASAEHRSRLRALPEDAPSPRARVPSIPPHGPDHAPDLGYAVAMNGGMATLARRL